MYGGGPHSHPKHEFRIRPHFRYLLGGVIVSHFGVVWEMYGKSLLFSPRNVHFTLSKMTIANQTQLTGDGSSVVPSKENDVIRFHAYVARENSAVDFIASMSLACLNGDGRYGGRGEEG